MKVEYCKQGKGISQFYQHDEVQFFLFIKQFLFLIAFI